jgi:hypothetical protein
MRYHSKNGLGASISIVSSVLSLAFLASAQAASAQASTTAATPAAHAGLISSLRHAHSLLVHADHDYDGHRAKAAEEVHKALVDLGYHHKKASSTASVVKGAAVSTPGAAAVASGKHHMHESQAKSDAQLKQALQILQEASSVLGNGKHPKANANINAAIAQINTALSLK